MGQWLRPQKIMLDLKVFERGVNFIGLKFTWKIWHLQYFIEICVASVLAKFLTPSTYGGQAPVMSKARNGIQQLLVVTGHMSSGC